MKWRDRYRALVERKRALKTVTIVFMVLFGYLWISVRIEATSRMKINMGNPHGGDGDLKDKGIRDNDLITKVTHDLKAKAHLLISQMRKSNLKAKNCSTNHLHVVGPGVGSFTNQILTLAQALTITTFSEPELTLVVPGYMLRTLEQFDMTNLKELYCLEASKVWTDADRDTVEAEYEHKKKGRQWHESPLERLISALTDIVYGKKFEISGVTRKSGSTAGPLREGDLLISSRDLFFWGGETYYGMDSVDEREVIAERITRDLERIAGVEEEEEYTLAGRSVSVSAGRKDTGAHHVFQLSSIETRDLSVYTDFFDHKSDLAAEVKDKRLFASHVSVVLAALWSSPRLPIHRLAGSILQGKGMENFSAAHRRGFEGTCVEGYKQLAVPELLKGGGLKDDYGGSTRGHPLCSMEPKFVRTWLGLLEKELSDRSQHVFLASDGQQDDSEWLRDKDATVGWHATSTLSSSLPSLSRLVRFMTGIQPSQDSLQSLADVLVSIVAQGDFMGQPRSTYSLQIYVLRMLVGRRNVMLGEGYDFYYRLGPSNWLAAVDFRQALRNMS